MFEPLFLQLLIVLLPSIAFQFLQLQRGIPKIVFHSRRIASLIWGGTAML
ncbi:hypothetical protein [Tumebacillus flagellatus]|nr:hypothetical protein [Tumebacillus flagellatus]